MSHFACLVIGDNPEKQLAPYQENNMEDCREEYLEFFDKEEEFRCRYENESNVIKQEYPTFEEYIAEYCDYSKDSKTGKYGYWENPNAKWDYYILGGRWSNFFTLTNGRQADSAKVSEIDFEATGEFITFAVIKNGKWYEKGEMGWFAFVNNNKNSGDWKDEFSSLVKQLPLNTLLSLYDCHI